MLSLIRPLQMTLLLVTLLSAPLSAQEVRSFSGQAHNVSVGLSDTVDLQITRTGEGQFALLGSFGTTDLAGDVAATGGYPTFDNGNVACAEGHECLNFSGTIMLDSRSGFVDGTETTFILHLDIDLSTGAATGVYHIGPLEGFTFEQYGLVTMSAPIS